MTLKKSLFAALVAVCAIGMATDTSYAFFGRHHGSCGSWGGSWGGSYGGSWGGWYGGSWGSCGSCGGYISYSSCGSCGSCGSYGGGYVSYGYDDGYAGSRVIADGVVVASEPTTTTTIAAAPTVKTSLTIHVPANTKLTLAGVETKQIGETRQFATTRLAAGQNWDNYKVVAEMTHNGQTVRQERTLSLTGGESQELTISFDSTKVARN
ncbi:MAG TPA: TIGR03000 domain-containing protein [Lacipirellulaceae bacterium]|nr:TIGR03000 domain-containing protein [Lacipirellulaceae bacterium]